MLQKIKLLFFFIFTFFVQNFFLPIDGALGFILKNPSESNLEYFNNWCLENKFGALHYLLSITTPDEKMQYTFKDFLLIISDYQGKDPRVHAAVFFLCMFPRDFFSPPIGSKYSCSQPDRKLLNIKDTIKMLSIGGDCTTELAATSITDLCKYILGMGKGFKSRSCYKSDPESMLTFKNYIIKSKVGFYTDDCEKGYDDRFKSLIYEINAYIHPESVPSWSSLWAESSCVVS